MYQSTLNRHTLGPFKNKHRDENCIIFGTGYSLKKFKNFPFPYTAFGCNHLMYWDRKMDYFVINDKTPHPDQYEDYKAYEPTIAKFSAVYPKSDGRWARQHDDDFFAAARSIKYEMEGPSGGPFKMKDEFHFVKDIDKFLVGDYGGSTIFACLQLALFMGFINVFIAGCDISDPRYFHDGEHASIHRTSDPNSRMHLMEKWVTFKEFAEREYPDRYIYTINPVGLKGMFIDFFTK